MEPAKKENLGPGTERKILEAAGKVFMMKGRLGASMQDIADEAGINRTLLHYYFRNKEKLFDTIFTKIVLPGFSKHGRSLFIRETVYGEDPDFCRNLFRYVERKSFPAGFYIPGDLPEPGPPGGDNTTCWTGS